jgi:hypothetical protein
MLEKISIITLIVWAVYAVFWDGMIFGFVSRWLSYRISPMLQKPIYACPACMAMWYGTVLYWVIWGNSFKEYAICVAGSIGLSTIILVFQPPREEELPDPHEN